MSEKLAFQVLWWGAVVLGASAFQPAAAQLPVPGALPSREQIETPTTERLPDSSQVEVRDSTRIVQPCPFADSPLRVDLQSVRFVGADLAPLPDRVAAALASISPPPGSQPLAVLCELRDDAATALNRAGFISAVQVPPQEIAGSEAVLQVILARLTDVRILGDPGPYGRVIASGIEQLKKMEPLNRYDAETILLLAGDVPGLDVALNLRPAGSAPGEVVGDLAVRYEPWTLVANALNSGSRQLGRESVSVRAEYFGLTGLSDRTFIGGSSTLDLEEQQVLYGGHSFGDVSGNVITLAATYARSRPDLKALDLLSTSQLASIDFTTPLQRSVTTNSSLSLGFEVVNQEVVFAIQSGDLPLTRDRLRVAYLRLNGGVRKPRFVGTDGYALGGAVELRRGLDIAGTTERGVITPEGFAPSRFGGDPEALVARANVNGFVSLTGKLGLTAAIAAQWSNGPLLSFEEYGVGSLTIGRGYDPGLIGGDRALAFRLEPAWQVRLGAGAGGQIFGFYDQATVWNLDESSTEDERTLRSWGFGARALIRQRFLLEAIYARPGDKALSFDKRRPDDRVLVSMTVRLSSSGL